jgi:HPt (histidine-containing phosphotransfer) domain-containing protein
MMTEERESPEGVINWSVALENAGGDDALLVDLVNIFLEEAAKHVSEIHRALNEQDYVLLNRAAHTLKGSSRIFQASTLMERAQQLEYQFRELAEDHKAIGKGLKDASVITPSRIAAAFAEAPRMVAELEPQLDRVIAAMRQRLER